MADNWSLTKIIDFIEFNPYENLQKGTMAKKVAMEQLLPFTRDISSYEIAPFNGGAKFRNGDTLMARITPCLENGKTAKVNILNDSEIGFGSNIYDAFICTPMFNLLPLFSNELHPLYQHAGCYLATLQGIP